MLSYPRGLAGGSAAAASTTEEKKDDDMDFSLFYEKPLAY
jgi:hypothetical protein